MFRIGEQVVYGSHGVCQVLEIESRTVDRRQAQYYVLSPNTQPSARFYVPTENPAAVAKLRKILSREELLALLQSSAAEQDCWIADENQRKQRCRELLNSPNRAELLSMVGTLHRHREAQLAAGRKFHQCDENFLRDAEKLLSSEISAVMEIPPEDVPEFLREQMGVRK